MEKKALTCEEIRDRFSDLREDELSSSEVAEAKGHLDRCSECQKELARFDTTLSMLHGLEEVEVPEKFLSGIYEKIEERKRKGLPSAGTFWKWSPVVNRWKLPIQALAMVAIVFLSLYLTKMMPRDLTSTRGPGKPMSSLPQGKKETSEAKAPAPEEKRLDQASVHKQMDKVEDRNVSGSPPSPAPRPQEAEAPQVAAPLSVSPWPEPSEEVVLKTADEEKTLSQLRELVKQFGGETLNAERNRLLVSLPNSSLAEFRKELEAFRSVTKAQQQEISPKASEGVAASAGKRRESEETNKKDGSPEASKEGRTLIRIVLIEE